MEAAAVLRQTEHPGVASLSKKDQALRMGTLQEVDPQGRVFRGMLTRNHDFPSLMKSMLRILLLLCATLCLGINPLRAEKMFEDESLGSLKLGQRADAVVKALGKPDSKDKEVLWEAIGVWVQEWHFPKQGLTLGMSSEKKGGQKIILNITAQAPCQLATSRGITIGSSEADLAKAYRDLWNKEDSTPGELFVAGSIYGGAMFNLENGKVVQIFIGAAAE